MAEHGMLRISPAVRDDVSTACHWGRFKGRRMHKKSIYNGVMGSLSMRNINSIEHHEIYHAH